MEATDEGILIKRVPTPAEMAGELAGVIDDKGRNGSRASVRNGTPPPAQKSSRVVYRSSPDTKKVVARFGISKR